MIKNRSSISVLTFIRILFAMLFTMGIISCSNPRLLPGSASGRILLIYHRFGTVYKSELMMMDGNGDTLRWVGAFSGSPAWSPSGKEIAVGCSQEDKTPALCIVEISSIRDRHAFPFGNEIANPPSLYQIQLPEQCKDIERGQGFPQSGILSTSWSSDATKIAVVCGNQLQEYPKLVCILSLDGDTNCWDESISSSIYRAVWSPVEDILAISGPTDPASKIYLIDPDGTNQTFLADGWSPEWSPDGERLAFIKAVFVEDGIYRLGIAMIDNDGTNQELLFLSDPSKGTDGIIFFDCSGHGGTCRLTWSPDGHYIAFVSSSNYIYSYCLYRLDIRTGEITILLDRMLFNWLIAEPDWGP